MHELSSREQQQEGYSIEAQVEAPSLLCGEEWNGDRPRVH